MENILKVIEIVTKLRNKFNYSSNELIRNKDIEILYKGEFNDITLLLNVNFKLVYITHLDKFELSTTCGNRIFNDKFIEEINYIYKLIN